MEGDIEILIDDARKYQRVYMDLFNYRHPQIKRGKVSRNVKSTMILIGIF